MPELDELSTPGVSGFFARQRREEGLTSNWFRALSLNEGDLERLNGYLLPLLGTDGRGGLSAREREVIATVVSGENRCAYCHTNHANNHPQTIRDADLDGLRDLGLDDPRLAPRVGTSGREARTVARRMHGRRSRLGTGKTT